MNDIHEISDPDKLNHTRDELKEKLVNLQRNLSELKQQLKDVSKAYRTQIKDIEGEIDGTMEQL